MSGSRADQDGQHSSWRPPGGRGRRRLVLLQLLASCCTSVLAESMQAGSLVLEGTVPADVLADGVVQRQGRNLGESPRELRPLIKKPAGGLTVRWARSTTVPPPRLPRQSPHNSYTAKPKPAHFIQPAFLLPFGQRLTKDSSLLVRQQPHKMSSSLPTSGNGTSVPPWCRWSALRMAEQRSSTTLEFQTERLLRLF